MGRHSAAPFCYVGCSGVSTRVKSAVPKEHQEHLFILKLRMIHFWKVQKLRDRHVQAAGQPV